MNFKKNEKKNNNNSKNYHKNYNRKLVIRIRLERDYQKIHREIFLIIF